MVSALRASADVLKHLHEQVGGTDGVEDVMERLRDESQKVEEVSGVINEGTGVGTGVDEGEVEEELEGLIREGKEETAQKEREREDARYWPEEQQRADLAMPDVPMNEPGVVAATSERNDEVTGHDANEDEDVRMTKAMDKRLSLMSLDEFQKGGADATSGKENMHDSEQDEQRERVREGTHG